MPNPNTFDEATAATEDLFANEQSSFDEPPAVDEETLPVDGEQTAENPHTEEFQTEKTPTGAEEPASAIEQVAQTAETAAQIATEKDSRLQQAMAEIEALKQQNQQLQGTIDEISKQNSENIVEEALSAPTIDINGLAFADEETQRAAMTKFAEEMSAYDRQQIMREMAPVLEYAKRGMHDAEKAEVIEALSHIPELAGIETMMPQLDSIITNNKWLSSDSMPMDEKYINAFAMAKGIESINNPPTPPEPKKEPTPEELLAMYNSTPAFQELVEKQRIDALKQSQQVPPFSASSGAVNAALNIKEKPQTLEEASKRTIEMFGGM